MNRKNLLYAAAFFTLFTFVGHSLGTLLPQEHELASVRQAQTIMESTMVPMPIGAPRSLAQMAYGGNVFISLYLLITGLFLILSEKQERYVKSLVQLNSVGLIACAIFSAVFYFPLPAICTGLAAALGIAATKR